MSHEESAAAGADVDDGAALLERQDTFEVDEGMWRGGCGCADEEGNRCRTQLLKVAVTLQRLLNRCVVWSTEPFKRGRGSILYMYRDMVFGIQSFLPD